MKIVIDRYIPHGTIVTLDIANLDSDIEIEKYLLSKIKSYEELLVLSGRYLLDVDILNREKLKKFLDRNFASFVGSLPMMAFRNYKFIGSMIFCSMSENAFNYFLKEARRHNDVWWYINKMDMSFSVYQEKFTEFFLKIKFEKDDFHVNKNLSLESGMDINFLLREIVNPIFNIEESELLKLIENYKFNILDVTSYTRILRKNEVKISPSLKKKIFLSLYKNENWIFSLQYFLKQENDFVAAGIALFDVNEILRRVAYLFGEKSISHLPRGEKYINFILKAIVMRSPPPKRMRF